MKYKIISKKMDDEEISKKLIAMFSDYIVCEDDVLDFEETVFNFGKCVCDCLTHKQQEDLFGIVFQCYDQAFDYMLINISSLRPVLEIYVNNDL